MIPIYYSRIAKPLQNQLIDWMGDSDVHFTQKKVETQIAALINSLMIEKSYSFYLMSDGYVSHFTDNEMGETLADFVRGRILDLEIMKEKFDKTIKSEIEIIALQRCIYTLIEIINENTELQISQYGLVVI